MRRFQPGWVEIDPARILSSCLECVEKACANLEALGISKDEIKAVGIANQRGKNKKKNERRRATIKKRINALAETTIVWNRRTGQSPAFDESSVALNSNRGVEHKRFLRF